MKKTEMLSVIIPIYNAEKYLDRCISSVVNQTYKDIEIILVNDYSQDSSLEICRKWENRDKRIITINKESNIGVAGARNCGLNIAKGKYISFVDSDDYIESNMYEELISSLKNDDYGFAMCSFYLSFKENKKAYLYNYPEVIDKLFFIKTLTDTSSSRTVWNKVFRKSIIEDLRFCEDIAIGEDTLFICQYLDKIEKISTVNKPQYNYNVINQDSVLKSSSYEKYITRIKAYDRMSDVFEKYNLDGQYNLRADSVCNYAIYKKCIGKNFDYKEYDQIIKKYMRDGLLFKVKGFKNKLKVFCAYYLKDLYIFIKR